MSDEAIIQLKQDEIAKLMETNFTYPDINSIKTYKKREFINYPFRHQRMDYENVKEYRDKICSRKFDLYNHSALLSNFISPLNTPE